MVFFVLLMLFGLSRTLSAGNSSAHFRASVSQSRIQRQQKTNAVPPHRQQQPPEDAVAMAPHPLRQRMRSDEEYLLQQLFGSYNQFARPVLNSSCTVTVAIQFSLMHIKDLDIRSQILTTTGLLILEWTDERLTWNPDQHNGMSEIIIEAKALWKPEFAVINGAEKIYEDYNQFRAVVSHRGLVHWEPGGVFKTMCEIDITYYPFDEQHCQLTFGAWSYHTAKMNLTTSTDTVNLDSYKKNGEWEILTTSAHRNEFSYECCPKERFSNVAFTIYLRRRHLFYVMNVIMPSVMTSVLLLSIFFCTPAQKVQIGVVVLLSFRIFLLNVAGNIPKTSDHIPLLVIYLTCTLAITTMSMVLTVLVLNLYGISDRPVPRWVKSLILTCLARTLGMCDTAKSYRDHPTTRPRRPGRGTSDLGPCFPCGGDGKRRRTEAEPDEAASIIEMNRHQLAAAGLGGVEIDRADVIDVSKGNDQPAKMTTDYGSAAVGEATASSSSMATATNGGIDDVTTSNSRKDPRVDYAKDWKRVAEIFDRFFFWLFLLAVILSTVVLFHPLIKIGLVN